MCARLRYWEEARGGQRKGWSDKHRQPLLGGLGLGEDSKTINGTAVKPQESGQKEDANMLDEADRKKFRRLAATLKYTIRREGNMHEDSESDTREWEETEEGSQISERSTKSDLGDADMDVHVDSDSAKGAERKSTSA